MIGWLQKILNKCQPATKYRVIHLWVDLPKSHYDVYARTSDLTKSLRCPDCGGEYYAINYHSPQFYETCGYVDATRHQCRGCGGNIVVMRKI